MLPFFDSCWSKLGLNDKDLNHLQNTLLTNPESGVVIPDTSGARKVRIAQEGRGKSGGGRVIYLDVPSKGKIYLLLAYPKNQQENITHIEKQTIRKLIEKLKAE